MYKKLLTQLLMFMSPIVSLAQFSPVLNEGNRTVLKASAGLGTYVIYDYTISCDTIIDTKQYNKVWRNVNNVYSLSGFVREDTALQEVYFLKPNTVQEVLTAKYGLALGDTVRYSNWNNTLFTVDSVYTNYRYGANRTIWRSKSSDNIRLEMVEGIGMDVWGILKRENELSLYIDSFQVKPPLDCVSLNISNPKMSLAKVFPNPSSSELNIQMNAEMQMPISIEVIDILGRQQFHTQDIKQDFVTLNLAHINAGNYILIIRSKNESSRIKFTKE